MGAFLSSRHWCESVPVGRKRLSARVNAGQGLGTDPPKVLEVNEFCSGAQVVAQLRLTHPRAAATESGKSAGLKVTRLGAEAYFLVASTYSRRT